MVIQFLNGKQKERIIKMKKRCILLVIMLFISIIVLSVNSNNNYLVKEESLATYIDDEKTDSFPAKGTAAFSKADCDNNTNIEWDNDTWGLYVTNLSNKVKCNIYFKTGENAVTKITNLASSDTTNMASDDPDNNIRYIGANPNNYVYFNCSDYANQTSETCEKWRIIGMFNNIEKEDGTKENLIKIINDENIGRYSWDTSLTSDGDGKGKNLWYQADLMKLLNPNYEFNKIGGSLYYNSTSGDCHVNSDNASTPCDFTKIGLKDIYKKAVENVSWSLGQATTSQNAKEIYEYERNSDVTVKNWHGKIAVLYASDYMFATSGDASYSRDECLNLTGENLHNNTDCYLNNYLYKSYPQWTLTPNFKWDNNVLDISESGVVSTNNAYSSTYYIRPTLFLKSNILITSGDGSSNTPYQLGI